MFDMSFCLRAARNLHDRMFRKLLHAPIKFFNCNPIARSPVYTHVSVTLEGLSTIRAYGGLDRFVNHFHNLQDLNMAATHLNVSIQKCFSYYVDSITALLVCFFTLMSVLFHSTLSVSSVGFLMSQLVYISKTVKSNITSAIDLQSMFTSVERVLEYGKMQSEAYEGSTGDVKPSDNWPQNGSISVYNMSLAYDRKNFVLKDICFSIIGGQKVGIVGRTGAGKTSLLNAIFRLEEPMGRLIIDGIDISKIQLHKLRKKLTVIPQEPVLFKNTIRCNLDPFDDYCDEQIWEALESVGILKFCKLLITDKIIQRTIRTKFKDFTVITIAHRIHTIIDADAVIVMDDGKIIEMNSPRNLVQDDKSNFYKMIMETESSAPLLIKHAMGSGFK
ncbi:Multidrug resistance-associated protein 4 [Nymphon striatum]|nr:Multidrug resistance-associated protein 4 [Nymphon striatum]